MVMSQQPQNPSTQQPLTGIRVLVTRPAHQAANLCALIEAAGGRAVRFPALEISAPPDIAAAKAALVQLDAYDLAIFISANAVAKALALHPAADWPVGLRRAAVGEGTARALARQGLPAHLIPAPPFDSESLLAHADLQQIAGQCILIVRGVGGRELLGDTLRARGAEVHYAEVYQRVRPTVDVRDILEVWSRGAINVVTLTSSDAMINLVGMLDPAAKARLLATPLVVVSARMVQKAQELGFTQPPRVAEAASDEALVAAVIAWRRAATAGGSE